MAAPGWLFLAYLLWILPCLVHAEEARISPISNPPDWQLASLLHLHLAPDSEPLQLTYNVYPLTEHAGLNQTDKARSSVVVRGSLVAAENPDHAAALSSSDTIAFLSCDGDNATQTVNQLMNDDPRAILLYSNVGRSCKLDGDDLVYNAIYTMGTSEEAADAMNNTLRAGGTLRASITGNATVASTPPNTQDSNGSNSAIAMNILYSITGLITLLFIAIIGTGAVRAHRYPERYGPRSGQGGRPSQSRARGLARAVLETLPIVKFGDPSTTKTDPSLELESQPSATGQDPALGTRLSAIPEEPRTPQVLKDDAAPMSGAVPQPEVATAAEAQSKEAGIQEAEHQQEDRPSDENLGCSICTEDFTVGEEVRLLPCRHQFHPPCIDPWLINISGTCPLCRLDLREHSEQTTAAAAATTSADRDDPFLSAPPLAASENLNDPDPTTTTPTTPSTDPQTHHQQPQQQQQRRRSSRFLDLHRLRHASVEERIEILRRYRSHHHQQQQQQQRQEQEQRAAGGESGEEQRGRGAAGLAERLRERFHIRTTRRVARTVGGGGEGGELGAGAGPS